MADATVVALYVGRRTGGPMESVAEVRAVPGRGLEGDRKFIRDDTPATKSGPDRELTLIEGEAIDALPRDYRIEFGAHESRRNIVTRGVPLNHLVGRGFRIGAVTLRGIRLCEPCSHLEALTRPGVMKALIHRGGLRAQILTGGTIRTGDTVVIGEEPSVVNAPLPGI